MKTQPLEPLQAAVTDQQIADFLALDTIPAGSGQPISIDPVAKALALSATGFVIDYLQRELVTRAREVIYQDWPFVGTATGGMSGSCIRYLGRVDLPYAAPLVEVGAVELYGGEQPYSITTGTTPAQLCFEQIVTRPTGCADPAIRAVYDAGYGDVENVPETIQTAILMMTAFLYEHRGQCDVGDALKRSGASALLQPYRAQVVVL